MQNPVWGQQLQQLKEFLIEAKLMDNLSDEELVKYGNIQKIQQHQENQLSQRLNEVQKGIDDVSALQTENSDLLDELLEQADLLTQGMDQNVSDLEINNIYKSVELTSEEKANVRQSTKTWAPIATIELNENWNQFETNMLNYASNEGIQLNTDPLSDLLSPEETSKIQRTIQDDFGYKKANCDKYDYTLAVISGTISGFIDIFFVGGGIDGKQHGQTDERGSLSKLSDEGFNQIVLKYARFDYQIRKKTGQHGKDFRKTVPENLTSAVQYLEMQYKVPYDAQYAKRLNGRLPKDFKMSASNHHLFSLAHYPDLVGLIFSILNQFNDTGTFISNGHLITSTMKNDNFELQGHNVISKIFCGFTNWIGHLMSDAIGSSGAVQKGNRGSGLPIPGTEIFQMLNFRLPKTDNLTFAKISTRVFEQGYDARHAAAAAIPVTINELLTRLLWALKQYFYHNRTVAEIVKLRNNPELNRMLLCSYGSFAMLDASDATIHGFVKGVKSGGNYAVALTETMSRLNVALYPRLALSAYKEVLR